MDFGSTLKARIKIDNRQQALLQQVGFRIYVMEIYVTRTDLGKYIFQDIAAEQSTMAYRAPELFDVKTGITLDEKVDIWVNYLTFNFKYGSVPDTFPVQSLGCTLYALAYLHSPFETLATTEQGGSIAMAVMNAQYKHPRDSVYSQGLRALIDNMLTADPNKRPDIHQV